MRLGAALSVAVVTVVSVALAAPSAMAKPARKASRADAPRLLADAVRTGTADSEAFAAITDWILHEKEERVAAGLVEVLGGLDPALLRAGADQRWAPTAQAVFSIFARALQDASENRHGSDRVEADLAELVGVAAPAVAAAMAEADPAARARFLSAFGALGPVADDLVPLLAQALAQPQREVRIGAATALAALGHSARAAEPALREAAKDADPDVRAAAGEALARIQSK